MVAAAAAAAAFGCHKCRFLVAGFEFEIPIKFPANPHKVGAAAECVYVILVISIYVQRLGG